jgi:hypothetical protein
MDAAALTVVYVPSYQLAFHVTIDPPLVSAVSVVPRATPLGSDTFTFSTDLFDGSWKVWAHGTSFQLYNRSAAAIVVCWAAATFRDHDEQSPLCASRNGADNDVLDQALHFPAHESLAPGQATAAYLYPATHIVSSSRRRPILPYVVSPEQSVVHTNTVAALGRDFEVRVPLIGRDTSYELIFSFEVTQRRVLRLEG